MNTALLGSKTKKGRQHSGARCQFEYRSSLTPYEILDDIAKALHERSAYGRSLVIIDRPAVVLSCVRKKWFRFGRSIQRERASTINRERIATLNGELDRIHNLEFSASEKRQEVDILFIAPEFVNSVTGKFMTIISCSEIEASNYSRLLMLTENKKLAIIYPTPSAAALNPQ